MILFLLDTVWPCFMEIDYFFFFLLLLGDQSNSNMFCFVFFLFNFLLVGIETGADDGLGHPDGAVMMGVYPVVQLGVVSIG